MNACWFTLGTYTVWAFFLAEHFFHLYDVSKSSLCNILTYRGTGYILMPRSRSKADLLTWQSKDTRKLDPSWLCNISDIWYCEIIYQGEKVSQSNQWSRQQRVLHFDLRQNKWARQFLVHVGPYYNKEASIFSIAITSIDNVQALVLIWVFREKSVAWTEPVRYRDGNQFRNKEVIWQYCKLWLSNWICYHLK